MFRFNFRPPTGWKPTFWKWPLLNSICVIQLGQCHIPIPILIPNPNAEKKVKHFILRSFWHHRNIFVVNFYWAVKTWCFYRPHFAGTSVIPYKKFMELFLSRSALCLFSSPGPLNILKFGENDYCKALGRQMAAHFINCRPVLASKRLVFALNWSIPCHRKFINILKLKSVSIGIRHLFPKWRGFDNWRGWVCR